MNEDATPLSEHRGTKDLGIPRLQAAGVRCIPRQVEAQGPEKLSDGAVRCLPLAIMEIDNATSQRDRNGVRPIIGPELRKYGRNMAFHSRFADAKLIRDMLVRISCRYQP